jgi:hypothetical protein
MTTTTPPTSATMGLCAPLDNDRDYVQKAKAADQAKSTTPYLKFGVNAILSSDVSPKPGKSHCILHSTVSISCYKMHTHTFERGTRERGMEGNLEIINFRISTPYICKNVSDWLISNVFWV